MEELLQQLLPHATDVQLNGWEYDDSQQQIVLTLASTQLVAACPVCHQPSHQIHSRYRRRLKDLPIMQFSLIILLEVCKFFCRNVTCTRRIFTERLPHVVAPWARRTVRQGPTINGLGPRRQCRCPPESPIRPA